jgi:hypothetical protein
MLVCPREHKLRRGHYRFALSLSLFYAPSFFRLHRRCTLHICVRRLAVGSHFVFPPLIHTPPQQQTLPFLSVVVVVLLSTLPTLICFSFFLFSASSFKQRDRVCRVLQLWCGGIAGRRTHNGSSMFGRKQQKEHGQASHPLSRSQFSTSLFLHLPTPSPPRSFTPPFLRSF